MPVGVFLSVHTPKRTLKQVGEAEVCRDKPISGRPAHFYGSGDNLLYCQHLLDQLGTRVSHTKVARSQLLDLRIILLHCVLGHPQSHRWLMTYHSSPVSCSGSVLVGLRFCASSREVSGLNSLSSSSLRGREENGTSRLTGKSGRSRRRTEGSSQHTSMSFLMEHIVRRAPARMYRPE